MLRIMLILSASISVVWVLAIRCAAEPCNLCNGFISQHRSGLISQHRSGLMAQKQRLDGAAWQLLAGKAPFAGLADAALSTSARDPCLPSGSDGIPVAGDGIPVASDGIPVASDGIPVASDGIPAASDRIPAASDRIPVAGDRIPVAGDGIPVAGDGIPVASDRIPAAGTRSLRRQQDLCGADVSSPVQLRRAISSENAAHVCFLAPLALMQPVLLIVTTIHESSNLNHFDVCSCPRCAGLARCHVWQPHVRPVRALLSMRQTQRCARVQ